MYLETLRVDHVDADVHVGQPGCIESGFSRIISTDSLAGNYVLGVARMRQGHLESCQVQKEVMINGPGINE